MRSIFDINAVEIVFYSASSDTLLSLTITLEKCEGGKV